MTGAAKALQEAKGAAQYVAGSREIEHMKKLIGRKRALLDAQLASLRGEFEAEEGEPKTEMTVTADGQKGEEMTVKRNRHTTAPSDEKEWELKLYVAGQTPKSLTAFANLKKICEDHLQGKYRIEVIDLLKNPRLAEGDQILAIPTLVRKLPEPIKKIIGDLSNTERVLVGLDLRPWFRRTA